MTTSLTPKTDKRCKNWSTISSSPAFTKVEWLLFVAMNMRTVVFYLPRLNKFDATKALGGWSNAQLDR